jgi:hypothetical protein
MHSGHNHLSQRVVCCTYVPARMGTQASIARHNVGALLLRPHALKYCCAEKPVPFNTHLDLLPAHAGVECPS